MLHFPADINDCLKDDGSEGCFVLWGSWLAEPILISYLIYPGSSCCSWIILSTSISLFHHRTLLLHYSNHPILEQFLWSRVFAVRKWRMHYTSLTSFSQRDHCKLQCSSNPTTSVYKQTNKSMLFPVKNTLYLWAGASLPSWKPFLKRRVMVFRYFMRPVPCPRRRELLRAQLSTYSYTSLSSQIDLFKAPTMSHLSVGISTRSASALLNVESTAVASSADGVSLGVSLTKRSGTLGL